MKNDKLQKISISVSSEHEKYLPDIEDAFGNLKVEHVGGLMRFSAQEMAMQVIIFLTTAFVGGAAWDLLKIGVNKLYKKFPKAHVTIRGNDSIMYTIKPDMAVSVIVTPERIREFEHIKSFDDLVFYLQNKIPFEKKDIPKEWHLVKLEKLGKIQSGSTPLRSNYNEFFMGGSIPWVKTMDLTNGLVKYTHEKITELAAKRCKPFKSGTVLVAMYGGFNQIGRTGLLCMDASINQAISAISVNRNIIAPEFLILYLNAKVNKWKNFAASSRKDPNITRSDVCNFLILLPPLDEQKRIINIINAWDTSVNNLKKKIEIKKSIKSGLMQNLLTGKVRLPGFSGKWKNVNLGNILQERKERDIESEDLLLFSLTIENGVCPKSERYDRSFLVKSDEKNYKKTCKNDIVYNPANLRFGAIAQNKNDKPVLLSPIYQVLYLKNEKENDIHFIGHLLTWDRQIRKMSAYAEGTLIERMEVKIDSFKLISISVPSFEEQRAIANVLTIADEEIKALEEKLTILKDQKKYLLNNLITGQIRTPENLSIKA